MNSSFKLFKLIGLFLSIISCLSVEAQTIECGNEIEISALESNYAIGDGINQITITLEGADGGNAEISGTCEPQKFWGGAGAAVTATFAVGNGTDELKPGGTLRFYAGRRGLTEKKCSVGPTIHGSGGGSSAVLYLPPGDDGAQDGYYLLAVAGGGGGGTNAKDEDGKGGNASEDGDGVDDAQGGTNGGCGESELVTAKKRAYGGGGYKCQPNTGFAGKSVVGRSLTENTGRIRVFLDGVSVGNTGGDKRDDGGLDGGDGFTGGGCSHGGGGGGGGFSGGAAKSTYPGGGGGNFLTSGFNILSSNKSEGQDGGGNGQGVESNGWAKVVASEDNIAPTVSCGTTIRALDENGQNMLDPFILFNSSDNCSIASQTVLKDGSAISTSLLDFDCSDLGNNIFEVIVIDGNNNPASCISVVVVVDNRPPSANCKDITATLDENGQTIVDAAQADNGSTDNCGVKDFLFMDGSETVNSLTFDCSSVGIMNTKTVLLRDQKNNTTECDVNISVVDHTAPLIVCPANIIKTTRQDKCWKKVTYTLPVVIDNCGATPILTEGLGSGEDFPIGTATETWTATDESGNSASCSFTVTVIDNQPPEIVCPADIVVDNDPGLCSAVATYAAPTGVDNCAGSITVRTAGLGVGAAFPVGTTTETYEVTDEAGNSASCSFTITVNDTEAPNLSCPRGIAVDNESGLCSAVVTYSAPAGVDHCSGSITALTSGLGSGAAFPVGTTIETYLASDGVGNTASCSFTVTVNDTEAPSLSCPADIVVDNDPGQCSAVVAYAAPAGVDHCSGSVTERIRGLGGGAAFPVGTTTETYLARDGDGNSTSCSFTITVNDTEAPSLSCPANITVDNDPNQCSAVVTYSAPAGVDHCSSSITSLTSGLGSGAAFPVGTTIETYLASDGAGNTTSCSFAIIVKDSEAPIVACLPSISVDNDPGQCSAVVTYSTPLGVDHCEVEIERIEGLGSGAAFPVGTTTETYLATDGAGNTTSCSFTVTVNDAEAPNFICSRSNIMVNNAPNQCSAVVTYISPLAFDNCPGGVNIVQTGGLGSGSAFPVGTTTERYTATDASGNSANCSFRVIVNDVEAPQIICPVTIEVSATSSAGAIVDYTMPEGTDNCAATTEQVAGLPGGATFPIGATVNTFTATDDAGNSQSCSFNVIVTGIAPNIVCPADITVNNDPGDCGAVVEFAATETTGIPASAIDYSIESGSLFSIGATAVTAIATNSAGSSSCTFNISVNDTESPTLSCPADISVDNDPGHCSAVVTYPKFGVIENCFDPNIEQIMGLGRGSAFPIGATTETYLATDASGNTAQCSFIVTVNDTEAPVAHCRDITIQLDAAGNGNLFAEQVDAGSSDNCGLASRAINREVFDCTDAGDHTVTLTITDYNGISNTCEASLTVEANSAAENISWTLAPAIKFWPPDYSYHTLTISDMLLSLTDACGGDLNPDDVWIDQVVSDEAEDDPGTQDGNTLNDIVMDPDCRSVQLRKEKMGGGNGRVYTVTLAYRDAAGNIGYTDFQASVPRWAWGWNSDAVKDGAMYSESCGGAGAAAKISSNPLSQAMVSPSATFQQADIQMEAYPNPFHSETNLKIQLPEAASVMISVYNLQGRLIQRLYEGPLQAGEHQQQWNGADVGGAPLPSGVYLIQLRSNKEVRNTKVLLQRH